MISEINDLSQSISVHDKTAAEIIQKILKLARRNVSKVSLFERTSTILTSQPPTHQNGF